MSNIVIEIGGLNFKGNVVDHEWFNYITFSNGKPQIVAIILLSEIVYWYRPTIIRDEESGQVTYKKKFKADKLQKSYQQFADTFGFSKVQIKRACDLLVEMELIEIEFRTIVVNDIKLNNVMFVSPNPEEIKRISTMYQKHEENPPNFKVKRVSTSKSGVSSHENKESPNFEIEKVVTSKLDTSSYESKEPPNFKVKTNTENTTENTTEITTENTTINKKDIVVDSSHKLIDQEFKISYNFLNKEGIPLSEIAITELGEYCDLFGNELIKEAVNAAIDKNAPNWRYIEGILKNWKKAGVKNLNDLAVYNKRYEISKTHQKRTGKGYYKRTEVVPDWLHEREELDPIPLETQNQSENLEEQRKRLEAELQKYKNTKGE